MVNVTHNNNNRGTGNKVFFVVGCVRVAEQLILFGENDFAFNLSAHILRNQGCNVIFYILRYCSHYTELHEPLDNFRCADLELLRKIADGDFIGNKNMQLFFLFLFLRLHGLFGSFGLIFLLRLFVSVFLDFLLGGFSVLYFGSKLLGLFLGNLHIEVNGVCARVNMAQRFDCFRLFLLFGNNRLFGSRLFNLFRTLRHHIFVH